MAENATATPATPAPAAAPAAAPAPPRTPDTIFDAAKARAFKAVNDELKPLTPPVAPHPSEVDAGKTGQPPAAPPKVDIDPEALKAMTKLNKELREARAKLKQLEPAGAEAAKLADARRLYGEGKRMEAVALLADAKDPNAEMEGLLAEYLKAGETKEVTAADLAKQIEADKAAAKAEKEKADAAAAEQAKTAQAEQAKEAATGFVVGILDGIAAQYDHVSKAENRAEAGPAILAAVHALREREGLTDEDLKAPEATRALVERAIDEVEVEYALEARREEVREAVRVRKGALQTGQGGAGSQVGNGATRQTSPAANSQRPGMSIPTLPRPGISTTPVRRNLTHEAAKQKALDAAKHGSGAQR